MRQLTTLADEAMALGDDCDGITGVEDSLHIGIDFHPNPLRLARRLRA